MSENEKELLTEAHPQSDPSIETDTDRAVRKFLTNKSPNLKWLSHQGSLIVSSRIACASCPTILGDVIPSHLLPLEDAELVGTEIGKYSIYYVKLDENKNFHFSAPNGKIGCKFGNRVSSIPPQERSVTGTSEVKIEKCGTEILIGNKIKLDKSKIEQAVNGHDTSMPSASASPKSGSPSRTKVSGRNAYEIRADVLELAIDWIKHINRLNADETDVLDIAKAFYNFVENK